MYAESSLPVLQVQLARVQSQLRQYVFAIVITPITWEHKLMQKAKIKSQRKYKEYLYLNDKISASVFYDTRK